MPTNCKDLHDALTRAREALLWKLSEASEYDIRRPMTATGTNLLGLVKHLATVQALYLGFLAHRPLPDPPPWMTPDMPIGADLWARSDETREEIIELFLRASAHADQTVRETDPDVTVDVPWSSDIGMGAPFARVLLHVVSEAQRHLGHADICRELIDGAAGTGPDDFAFPGPDDVAARRNHVETVEAAARSAARPPHTTAGTP